LPNILNRQMQVCSGLSSLKKVPHCKASPLDNSLLSLSFILNLPEQATVITRFQILLPDQSVLLEEHPSRPPLHQGKAPAGRVCGAPVLCPQIRQIPRAQRSRARGIKSVKQLVKFLRVEVAVNVVDTSVRTVLGFVDVLHVYAEQWVWQPTVPESCRVGKEDWDQKGADGEKESEAKFPETCVDIHGMNDSVGITVPELDVLLKNSERLILDVCAAVGSLVIYHRYR
jgi:hypothetical protein